MIARAYSRKALVALVQACLIASTIAPALSAPAKAQDETPLVVDLRKDNPERIPGAKPDPKTLEGGIWADAAKAEHEAKSSGERNSNPDLDAYVAGVESKVAGPFAGDIRVYVMDRPFFNAEVGPNGYAEVWSGLLLRAQTEDQLAFVLGHETGHFRHSHSMKRAQEIKDGGHAAVAVTALIAIAVVGATANAYSAGGPNAYQSVSNINSFGGDLINITYLGTVAALMSYSRDTEAQADSYGMTYATSAGYFPGAAPQLWRNLLDETASSDFEKVRRSPTRNNIFGSHPLEKDRIDALSVQDRKAHGGSASARNDGDEKAARLAYRQHIRPFLGAWLKDDLRRQDFGQTLWLVNRLSVDGEDAGVLNFYAGEAYRLRGDRGTGGSDLENAIVAYKKALESPDAPKETWRQLGEVFRRLGSTKDALDAFNKYLALAPDASDAWMVQDQVDTLTKSIPSAPAAPATSAAPAASPPAAASASATPSSGGTTP